MCLFKLKFCHVHKKTKRQSSQFAFWKVVDFLSCLVMYSCVILLEVSSGWKGHLCKIFLTSCGCLTVFGLEGRLSLSPKERAALGSWWTLISLLASSQTCGCHFGDEHGSTTASLRILTSKTGAEATSVSTPHSRSAAMRPSHRRSPWLLETSPWGWSSLNDPSVWSCQIMSKRLGFFSSCAQSKKT